MIKREDIGYLVGWFGGILPPFGWALAMAFAAKGQRRHAFQALIVGWWTVVLFLLSKFVGDVPNTNLIMLSWHVMPVATLFAIRRSAWPPCAEPDEAAADSAPNEKNSTPTSAAVQAVIVWALVVVGLAFALSSPGSYGAGVGAKSTGGLLLVYGIVLLTKSLLRRDKSWRKAALCSVFAVGLMLIGDKGVSSVMVPFKRDFAPLLDALEKHRQEKSEYPKTLGELVPSYLASLPDCPYKRGWNSWKPEEYYYRRDDGTFIIQCAVGVFLFPTVAIYESDSKYWLMAD
jgi:hypothetical protein